MSWLDRLMGTKRPLRLQLHGIAVELHNRRDDIDSSAVLHRLDEALTMVSTYQPQRFRHLVRDIRGIRIERFPTRGAFLPSERVVLTELTFLARRDISAAPVASSILHEGVHARVHAFRQRLGSGAAGGGDMAREERLCRRAELAFGQALPADLGGPVIERALASLALTDRDVAPVVDWSLARARQDEVDRS